MSSETIKSNGKVIHQAVKNWVEQYESDPKSAVAEILLMLFEVPSWSPLLVLHN